MRSWFFTAVLIIIGTAWGGSAFGQNEVEAIYRRGLNEYNQDNFTAAVKEFRDIIIYDNSTLQGEAHVMLAKALYRLREFDAADSISVRLRKMYPGGRYAEWTYYMEAACNFRKRNVRGSLVLLSWLAGTTSDSTLRENSIRALQFTVRPFVDPGEFLSTMRKYRVSEEELISVSPYNAESLLQDTGEGTIRPDTFPSPQEMNLQDTDGPLKIGLLVPLTGKNSELGNQLYRGVRAAFAGRDNIAGRKLELIVEDTESDPVVTVLRVRTLAEQGVIAIIGPVYSVSNITGAVESNAHGIPFIAPTATDAGLTGIGRYVFQLNFAPNIQAKALADFAAGILSVSNAAIIASRDTWGQEVAKGFVSEAEKKNISIVRTDFFIPNSESLDIDAIIRNLRKIAPKYDAFIDSTRILLNTTVADTAEVDSTIYASTTLTPIDTIGAVLISATESDAIKIASKLMEYNIITVLLGDSGWNRPSVPEEGRIYVDGAYVVAPPGELSRGLGPVFSKGETWNDDRLTVAMKGYDAGLLIINGIERGARDAESLAEKIADVKDLQGASSRITIHPTMHMNTAVDFVRIQNRKFQKVRAVSN